MYKIKFSNYTSTMLLFFFVFVFVLVVVFIMVETLNFGKVYNHLIFIFKIFEYIGYRIYFPLVNHRI